MSSRDRATDLSDVYSDLANLRRPKQRSKVHVIDKTYREYFIAVSDNN